MINADTNGNSFVFDSITAPALYSTVGTTLSMLNGNEDLYLPSVIEATIAGKAGDLQPNLWVTGQNSSNLASMDSSYPSPGTGLNKNGGLRERVTIYPYTDRRHYFKRSPSSQAR